MYRKEQTDTDDLTHICCAYFLPQFTVADDDAYKQGGKPHTIPDQYRCRKGYQPSEYTGKAP
ncbi:hypothetical protein D3C72_672920 [compost metagenome]